MIMRMNDGLQKNADKIGKDEFSSVLSACNTCGIYIDSVSAITNTSKHRVWSPKRRLVRNIPETFKGLGFPQQPASCPQKAMLAGEYH